MKKTSVVEFAAMNAALMALVALAVNIILPAFTPLSAAFGIGMNGKIGLIVSVLYLGLAMGQVFWGTISDMTGRRRALLLGQVVFVIGVLVSMIAPDFNILVAGQLVQGFGLGAPRVVTLAALRDRFEGNTLARTMSFVMAMFSLVPTTAPFFGQLILSHAPWQAVFAAVLVVSFAILLWFSIRFSETLPVGQRSALAWADLLRALLRTLNSAPGIAYAAALGVMSSVFIGWLALSQQILAVEMGFGSAYPLVFAGYALSLGLASFTNGVFVARIGALCMVVAALGLILVAAVALDVLSRLEISGLSIATLTAIAVCLFAYGTLVTNLNAMALSELTTDRGIGASLLTALTTLISVPGATFVGFSYTGSASVIPAFFGLSAIFSALLVLIAYGFTKRRVRVE